MILEEGDPQELEAFERFKQFKEQFSIESAIRIVCQRCGSSFVGDASKVTRLGGTHIRMGCPNLEGMVQDS